MTAPVWAVGGPWVVTTWAKAAAQYDETGRMAGYVEVGPGASLVLHERGHP